MKNVFKQDLKWKIETRGFLFGLDNNMMWVYIKNRKGGGYCERRHRELLRVFGRLHG